MDNNSGRKKDPEFIREVVKEKKKNKKSIVLKALFVLIIAAAAAAVAGVVFTLTCSGMRKALGEEDDNSNKVSISDSSSEGSQNQNSSSQNQSSSDSSVSDEENDPEVITEIIYETDLTLDDYKQLYSEMYRIARGVQGSLVSVTGITSQIDYFDESYENEQRSIGLIVAETAEEYYILTYSNILANVENIHVTFDDEYSASAVLQRSDSNTGLAVIRTEKSGMPQEVIDSVSPAMFASSSAVRAGDLIIVIGNPDGYEDYIAYGSITSTSNKISVYDTEYDILTTNIPDGSEGIGILLDLNGNVIGITTSNTDAISDTTITAIPISEIRSLVEILSNNESRSYAGIRGSDVSELIAAETGMPVGVIVVSLAESSPAMMSGMMEYDIIVAVDGNPVASMDDFSSLLQTYTPGTTVNISVMRQITGGYTQLELTFELGEI